MTASLVIAAIIVLITIILALAVIRHELRHVKYKGGK